MIIITGPVHSGKTTLLKRLSTQLMSRMIPLQGYLSLAVWESKKAVGYDLFNLEVKKSIPFIRTEGEKNWENIGIYYFLPSGLAEAKKIISNHSRPHWLFVDEIGPLELSGKGVWPALRHSISIPQQNMLCVVREQILDTFRPKIAHTDLTVWDIRQDNLFSILLERLSGRF